MANNDGRVDTVEISAEAWKQFLHWAQRCYELERFDEDERDYKLIVAANLVEVRRALMSDDPAWLEKLRKALNPPTT